MMCVSKRLNSRSVKNLFSNGCHRYRLWTTRFLYSFLIYYAGKPPWELDWDLIETGAVEVDYRQHLTKTVFEEWVIADKKPLK
jgi:hypothetical protein